MSTTYIWLIAGVVLLVAEVAHIPGVGLMFAGLGAVTTSLLISNGYINVDDTLWQAIAFLLATSAWTAILWKPLQKFRVNRKQRGYSNIVGETAIVGENGVSKLDGSVTWSGTIMKAKLAANVSIDQLPAGAAVTIIEVSGATLTVTPKA